MSESVEEMRCNEVVIRIPDHLFLQWDIVRDGVREVRMVHSHGLQRSW